jgi:hypothetical protein
MARKLVQNKQDVLNNFETLVALRESPDEAESSKYKSLIKSAKVLVVAKVDGQREYGPSRFVGYRSNSLSEHHAHRDTNDGRETNPPLAKLFGGIYYADPVESTRFKKFCKKHGIDKDIDGLNTPIKFIFADYSPSSDAILTKLRSSDSESSTLDDVKEDIAPPALTVTLPLNQILYGPPGTGKTYHTIARAVALLEQRTDEEMAAQYPPEKRAVLRQKFEDYRQAQRIEFVTFHQAFSYEDFVEGIKPLPPAKESQEEAPVEETKPVQYDVVPGVFRRICESAAAAANTAAAPPLPDFDTLYDGFITQLHERRTNTKGSLTFYSLTGLPMTLTDVDTQSSTRRLTFLHANSAQQDHHIDKQWIEKLYRKYTAIDQIKNLTNDITKAIGGSNGTLMWVVFNELKKYETTWIAQERAKKQTSPAPPFILIIDEINRGNVANIFGELITLLEDDKRAGGAEALSVTLPYSKEKFSVPSNLYVLGTMNTADRSVEALDTALRRRFSFMEMLPRPALLPTDVEGINLREMLVAINTRLEQLLDHDHCIGHALLIQVKTFAQLREAFRRSILPLLQEYFFGDWGKIGLVLGAAFITHVNKKAGSTGYKLLPFGSYSIGELSEKPVYRLADLQQVPIQAFQAIYTF